MSEFTITTEQIRLMKHSIGYEPSRVKRMKYEAFRNYFCAGNEMLEFEDLVTNGLAIKRLRQDKTFYFITDKGIALLSEITGVSIKERD